MPLSARRYECAACGFEADRDFNAAVNLENYVNK
ncbi:MAG: zinc ribbon domain-containing protein [Trichodesmium sp. MO_231.B1]|nr:zinc ribbon domain-containing protein [Trichodesmium sp. MO_231.B1]